MAIMDCILLLCATLFFHGIGQSSAKEKLHSSENIEPISPAAKTNFRVNIPNIFNLFPDLDKLYSEFQDETLKESGKLKSAKTDIKVSVQTTEPPTSAYLSRIRENYKRLREIAQSTLRANTRDKPSDILESNFNRRSKTSLEADMPAFPVTDAVSTKLKPNKLLDAYAEKFGRRENSAAESPVTEIPLSEYFNKLLKEQTKWLSGFSQSVLNRDGLMDHSRNHENVKHSDSNPVGVSSLIPAKAFVQRTGEVPPAEHHEIYTESNAHDNEDLEPQEEHLEDLPRNQMKLISDIRYDLEKVSRSDELHVIEENTPEGVTKTLPPSILHLSGIASKDNPVKRMLDLAAPADRSQANSKLTKFELNPTLNNDTITKRSSMIQSKLDSGTVMAGKFKDPIKRMTDFYHDLNKDGSADLKDESLEPSENFDEYIEDLEEITGTLSRESKGKLKTAFGDFQKSLENIEFKENIDLKKLLDVEPEDKHSWLSHRIIDQRDLEIAFYNLDKETNEMPSSDEIVAFTLTGVPVKLRMDPEIKDPVGHLHNVLTEAGVTLNIPVHSSKGMTPLRGTVLYVGSGNRGKSVTEAVSLRVPDIEYIKKYVRRFSKVRNPQDQSKIGQQNSNVKLSKALKNSLVSNKSPKFSESLVEDITENPMDVLIEIVNFLNDGPRDFYSSEESDIKSVKVKEL